MEIARSTCSNGLVWKELWHAEHCFVGSKHSNVSVKNATTTPSHGSGCTMELILARRGNARPDMYGVWEGHGAEAGAMC